MKLKAVSASDRRPRASNQLFFIRWFMGLWLFHFAVGLPLGFLGISLIKSANGIYQTTGRILLIWHEPLYSFLMTGQRNRLGPPLGFILLVFNSALWAVAAATMALWIRNWRSKK